MNSAKKEMFFRSLVEKLLKEAEAEEAENKKKPELHDSLDSQVDDYLLQYEKDSRATKKEGADLRTLTKDFFLLEAEDEEKKDDAGGVKKLTENELQIEEFASNVVRLIENYDSLLSIEDTIIRRTINFLSKNYEESVIESFKIILEDQYDMSVDKPQEQDFEKYQAPPADRASGSLSGGGG